MSLPDDPAEKSPAARLFAQVARWTVINFVAFVVIAAFLGGDALNAMRDPAAEGLYALKGPGNGAITQVSAVTWVYSLIHASISIGLVVLTLGLGLMRIMRK